MPRRIPIPRGASVRNVSSTSDPSHGIQEITFSGVPEGMAPAIPAHELPDTMAQMIVDAFVHNPGMVVRRGPIQAYNGSANLTYPGCGLVSVADPTGTIKIAALHGDATHGYLAVYSSDFTTHTDIALGVNLPTSTAYRLVQPGPRLNGGGVYLSIMDKLTQGSTQTLLLWAGSGKAAYTTGTVTTTRGSTSVVGVGTSWTANVDAGMFLFANSQFVGVVKSVTNNTTIVLQDVALVTQAGVTYSAQPLRGINPRVAKGFITTSTTSTTVNGANTKFQADGMATGTWDIYRSSDMTWIGLVSAIVSDIQLTLNANATLNLDQEPYIAILTSGSYSSVPNGVGAITSVWGGRQTYANNGSSIAATSQITFSSVDDAEAVDSARRDGDFLTVPSVGGVGNSTPILATEPTSDSLLILKPTESYALFGNTTAQFQIVPVGTDGCLSPMSVQSWNGLVVYAGQQGIYMYDGQEAVNVTQERLGWYYQSCVKTFDPTTKRMWSMIARDHYFLFIEAVTPPVSIYKGASATTPTTLGFVMHLPTQAITLVRNVNIRASIALPAPFNTDTLFLVTNSSGAGVLCSANTLFDSTGNDTFACDTESAGPDFYLETKKYSIGDPLLKKLWKMLLLTYLSVGDTLRMDTVPGLNTTGTTSATAFLASSTFQTKRIKFLKRAQMMSFRFWQNSSSITSLKLGPWAVVIKPQRVGRT